MGALVTASWLAERLQRGAAVAVDATMPPVGVSPPVDTRARYVAEHIPGAVFFDIDELSDQRTALPHMLPDAETFSRAMSRLGVGDAMTIVVYEQEGVYSAPRAWWMLRSFDARAVYLLDGGLRAWKDAGLPTESGEVRRGAAKFSARLDASAVRDFEDVQAMIGRGGQIREQIREQVVDARSAGRFRGTAPEPRAGIASGHVPGAISVPFGELVEDGRMMGAARLREMFRARGVRVEEPVTTMCGSGVTAAVVLLGLELAGAKKVSLYDGSWAEYAQRPEAAIERDEAQA
ncbi:MAG TPA: 3-mercaptopyruvate sulfurtransferase [Acidobacteriaceae bacterium]|jgi:thiosulfate/3-mercaptopyruvate sulfurtransferase|nr:3-mercaptopyruvate sulfurtransferase [Acidobacteriaceae bacterium]